MKNSHIDKPLYQYYLTPQMKYQCEIDKRDSISGTHMLGMLLGIFFLCILFCVAIASCDGKTHPAHAGVVAEVIAAEAGGEGLAGMQAVACTIANRARIYHKTPHAVVTQRNQYYGLTARNRVKLYASVCKQADYLAANIMTLPDITHGALYFRTAREKHFAWCKVFTVQIGKHLFYK